MGQYLIRRALAGVLTLLVLSFLVFVIIRSMPGDPAAIMAGVDATQEQIAATRKSMHLDEPIYAQYFSWLITLSRGDFGVSSTTLIPVITLLAQRLPVTLELICGSMLIGTSVAFIIGFLAVVAKKRILRQLCSLYLAVAYATPSFWIGILLVIVFSMTLKWFPPSGYTAFTSNFSTAVKCSVLPWLTIGIKQSAIIGRYVKFGIAEEMSALYISVARSKGVSERAIVLHHALRNALIPVVTVFGLQVGFFAAGAIITETIFNLPGIGRLLLYAFFARDYPILQIVLLFVGFSFVVVGIVVDFLYGVIDPRIRYS